MAFLKEELEYNLSMPAINLINCKKNETTKAFAFLPSMFSESSIISNLSVFEDFNVKQMGMDKTDPC